MATKKVDMSTVYTTVPTPQMLKLVALAKDAGMTTHDYITDVLLTHVAENGG